MITPLVSIICLCYNQSRYVQEAIRSVLNQTYANLQLIVVDDGSTDDSLSEIKDIARQHPHIQVLALSVNSGNCKAFNRGLSLAQGAFIIDLAADDVLLPDRVQKGVEALTRSETTVGVNFSDAEWITADGSRLYRHSDRFPHTTIPQGDIYKDLISRFFVCSPSMMFKREVIDSLGGYDESMTYEDFDFWVRSSRRFRYNYIPEVLVKKRVVKNSLSEKQFRIFSPHLSSTFRVCEKIMDLNISRDEQLALAKRILYEMRVCVRCLDFPLTLRYAGLYRRNAALTYPR